MADQKILVVEDDPTLRSTLEYNLVKQGYKVIAAVDGMDGLEKARQEKPDLIILDLMLPRLDGLEVGADDYMTKPFSMRELLARVKAMLRRNEMIKAAAAQQADDLLNRIQSGNIEIDPGRHSVQVGGREINLNPIEFDLLVFLVRNKGQVFSRDTLLDKVWGYNYAGDTRTVDVHIRWLREKLESNPEKPVHLVTLRGVGYKYEE